MVPPNACPNPHYTAVELAASQMSRRAPVASSLRRSAKRQRSTREKRKQRFVVIVPFWPALSAAAIPLAGTFTAYAPRKKWQDPIRASENKALNCQPPVIFAREGPTPVQSSHGSKPT
jgi:hypothetical protein